MALEMRPNCERCQAETGWMQDCFMCSYECTFCRMCAQEMRFHCPNCGGELVKRPKRQPVQE